MNPENKIEGKTIYFCWAIATIATLGSLFFSEVMKFPPCTLCWYQRIAMYPLALLFTIGFFQPVKSTIVYTLPLAVIGWISALYHNLLHYGIVPESASPCQMGISCSTVYVYWFGFFTIPMLSLFAFTAISAGLIFLNRRVTSEK
jgi:disulfide bond formation protein DsbB